MIRSSAYLLRQADPVPALPGRHGERRSYTTPWDTIRFRYNGLRATYDFATGGGIVRGGITGRV